MQKLSVAAALLILTMSGAVFAGSLNSSYDDSLYDEALSPYAIDEGAPQLGPQSGNGSTALSLDDQSIYEEALTPFAVDDGAARFDETYARWLTRESQRASRSSAPVWRGNDSDEVEFHRLYGTD